MSVWDDWLAARADERDTAGLTRRLVESDAQGLLDLAGNDYLGLSLDSRVREGAVEAVRRFGAGARASRLVSGTLSLHSELERSLAALTGFATGLVLSTGYHANLSVVSALADHDTLVVSDAHVHASLIDACRLSRGSVTVVAHNDVGSVATALRRRTHDRAIVVVESIYSVLGDAAPLADLAAVCADHDAVLLADEAHALGVVGPDGAGLLAAHGLAGAPQVVATGTLSKALGAQGGVVLAGEAVRDHLVNAARPFIYDTGLAPAAAGAALAALDVLRKEPDLLTSVRRNAEVLAEACAVPVPDGAVLSVPVAGPREAVAAVAAAKDRGVRVGCFRPPSTPDGSSRLRVTAHAHHSESDMALAVDVLRAVLR